MSRPISGSRQVASWASTCWRRSPEAGTRCLVALFKARGQILRHRSTDQRYGDSVDHLPEESLDQHPLGDRMGNPPALQVEEVFGVHRTDGCAVAAAQDVVIQDLEDGLGGRLCLFGKQRVAFG